MNKETLTTRIDDLYAELGDLIDILEATDDDEPGELAVALEEVINELELQSGTIAGIISDYKNN